MIVILVICLIYLVGIFIYTVPKEMKDEGSIPKVVEAQKKAEPTIQITIDLYDKQTALDGTHYKYQVPISHVILYP